MTESSAAAPPPLRRSLRRSKLITPAGDWELISKAARSGTDIVHLELEDGVPLPHKEAARAMAVKALREQDWGRSEVWARINPLSSGLAARDVEVVTAGAPDAFLLAKASGPEDVRTLDAMITDAERAHGLPVGRIRIAVVIERIRALHRVEDIAVASPRMTCLNFGAEDMATEYGYRRDRRGPSLETLYARSRIVLAARLGGIDCIDVPYLFYKDIEGTERDAGWAAQIGFSGKSCISPRQIPVVHKAFAPSPDELAWATKVVEGHQASLGQEKAVWIVDGMMTDAPHLALAQRIIERAEQASPSPA